MGELTIGEYTYGKVIRRGDMNNVTIGKFCSIADNVRVDSGFHHRMDFVSTFPFKSRLDLDVPHNAVSKGDITIGHDVWIGEDVIIMGGITIGNGAVIGAGSIVTKNVGHYCIVAGSPAKQIGEYKRFTEEQIKDLLQIEWWNWDIKKIEEEAHLLNSNNIDKFIEKWKH